MTTLLFDLDNTLVQIRNQRKLRARLLVCMAWSLRSMVLPWRFPGVFSRAIQRVRNNETALTNHELLVRELAAETGASPGRIDEAIQLFVRRDFPSFGSEFLPMPGAREVLLAAGRHGFQLVVATNPLFALESITQRLAWAGLADIPFAFMSHSGVMTRCKPRLAYYQELLGQLGVSAERCAMIGDDADNDMPASRVGIRTFLIDSRVRRADGHRRVAFRDLELWMDEQTFERPWS